MKKLLSFALVAVMLLALLAGCGQGGDKGASTPAPDASAAPSDKPAEKVTLKMYQLKVEIADALAEMKADYEKEHPGVTLEIETVGGGADYGATLVAKFSAGDDPDIFNTTGYEDMLRFFDKEEDLTNEPWVKDAIAGTLDGVTKDGKIYGQPQAIEGFGFAYNKDLFEKAGITEIPKTIEQLEEAAKKLQAAGIQPFVNSYGEWWVLGVHNITIPLSHQADPDKFIQGLKDGSSKLKGTDVGTNWLNLIDLTVKYGQKNPLQTDYNTSVTDFATGKAAMIQQGNWIQPSIDKLDANLNVGFLPMPISNEEDDKLHAGVPQYWCVANTSKAKDQAKEFLNWIASSETGKKYVVEKFGFIPAFKSIEAPSLRALNASLSEYAKADKVYTWQFAKLPPGATNDIGDALQAYIGGQANKDQTLEKIENIVKEKAQ